MRHFTLPIGSFEAGYWLVGYGEWKMGIVIIRHDHSITHWSSRSRYWLVGIGNVQSNWSFHSPLTISHYPLSFEAGLVSGNG